MEVKMSVVTVINSINTIVDIILVIFILKYIKELKTEQREVANVYVEIMCIYGEIKAIERQKGNNKVRAKKEPKQALNMK